MDRPSATDIHLLLSDISSGEHSKAMKQAEALLAEYPSYPVLWKALGTCCDRLGNHQNAMAALGRLLVLTPRDAEAWNLLGGLQSTVGDRQEAIRSYRHAIRLQPEFAEAHCNLGNLLRASGLLNDAISSCRNAVCLKPALVEAQFNLALALSQSGATDSAVTCYRRSLRQAPSLIEGWNNLGDLLMFLGNNESAEHAFNEAISREASHAMARVNLANLLGERREFQSAKALLQTAILLQPDLAEAYGNLGNIQRNVKAYTKADLAYARALGILPTYADAHSNRGNLQREMGRYDEAIRAHHKAICLRPDFTHAYYNLGVTAYRAGSVEKAHESYGRAIQLCPDFSEAQLSQGFLYLSEGRYAEGWPLYEWRFQHRDFQLQRRVGHTPEWNGSTSLKGKVVLLYAEQGLGDTIQFSRYAEVIERMGARVFLEVQSSLVGLLDGIGEHIQVLVSGAPSEGFDYQMPLMSLPYLLKTSAETIPACPTGLLPRDELVQAWISRLGERLKPRIGLVLSGNPNHVNDELRSISWEVSANLLSDDYEFICLQKEIRDCDHDFIKRTESVSAYAELINDFQDTAALCTLMDVIVTVDTSVAHLAASLGVPTWILLPTMPDWRWLMDRQDSPWYPTVRLFRKAGGEGWEALFLTIRNELKNLLASSNSTWPI